jgi:lysophospholipase L1-like esterase
MKQRAKRIIFKLVVLGLLSSLSSCGGSNADVEYVALGASDTLGVGLTPITNSYPSLIDDQLENRGKETDLTNLGIPSAEVDEVRELEVGIAVEENPDLITLSIGPNDIVNGTLASDFETELTEIFQELRGETDAFLVVATIPDLTQLPRFAEEPDPDVSIERVNEFNQVILRQAAAFQVPIADLRPYAVGADVTTDDGFHPNDEGHQIIAREFLKIIEPQFFP